MDAETRTVWLLGDPVAHSRSPHLHNRIYGALALNLVYLTLRVPKGQLAGALKALETIRAVGANLTMPLKSEVFPLLHGCTPAARAIGAVNSLRLSENGWEGENTDWLGWLDSWDVEMDQSLEGRKAIVLGAGGASKAIVYALHSRKIGSVSVLRRDWAGASEGWLPGCPIRPLEFNQAVLNAELEPGCVVINCTPIGTWPNQEKALPLSWPKKVPEGCVAADLIYNPNQTLWLKQGARRGAQAFGGMGMLVHQAARAISWWSGLSLPDSLITSLG
jgi:shikimate dehydrogenase